MEQPAVSVAHDVWRITTPLPFRPRTVHAYLARAEGGGWMLVDGGANTPEAWRALEAGLQVVGIAWRDVALHVVTHMHIDHIGLAARVRSASLAPLGMGILDAERAEHAHFHPEEESRYRETLFREHGAPDELVRAAAGGGGGALSSFVPADHVVGAGGGALPRIAGWHAVWTPGHTAGHIALHRPADGVVIAGDAVLPRVSPTIGVNRQRDDAVGDYLDALARLAALPPGRLLPGHGEPLDDPMPRIREMEAETRAETARVLDLLGAEPRTAWQTARARYADRELPPAQQMQALRETLAHLRHLVARGEVVEAMDGGVARFWRPR